MTPSTTAAPSKIKTMDFVNLIIKRGEPLINMAAYLSQQKSSNVLLRRPFLGELLSQSGQLEELLDAYNARNNRQWCSFRSLTAAIKLFADVGYELLHIQHTLPNYKLLPIEQDFNKATNDTLQFVAGVLLTACNRILDEARKLKLPLCPKECRDFGCEQLPAGRLPHDRRARKIANVGETVTMLATAFLNLAAESNLNAFAEKNQPIDYKSYVPASFTEENLRSLELRFHNLQSLYDTYVSETETELLDTDLPVLRGHISVVFHLLRTATAFVHYYERHVSCPGEDLSQGPKPLVDCENLLAILTNYSITYSSCYILSAQRLCQAMLKKYAELGKIKVPVPRYRGFHVRPSTLIAKLVHHYGSDVKMKLEDELYDASSPLELFRANEKINAGKRRSLAEEIVKQELVREKICHKDIKAAVRRIVLKLAEQGKVILYEQPLQLPVQMDETDATIIEKITDMIAQLLAIGKIDIVTNLEVTFTGDKRVLADVKLLAESGYGEDNYGNNISLPQQLEYLRR